MADSTVNDVSKMKVVDLRKELKSRGLSYVGDKAELVSRLQADMAKENQDVTLDSDEIDSDGVLDDDDDKNHHDILDDTAVDTLNEELELVDNPPPEKVVPEAKPTRTLKRKIALDNSKDKTPDTTLNENKEAGTKKIVLNRTISYNPVTVAKNDEETPQSASDTPSKVKITSEIDAKTRLEMRAKRFGLPVKVSDADRKEARKQRFGQGTTTNVTTNTTKTSSVNLSDNLEKLKKRAERFGQSVSKIMSDIENKEKLEKRKAKFCGSD